MDIKNDLFSLQIIKDLHVQWAIHCEKEASISKCALRSGNIVLHNLVSILFDLIFCFSLW